MQQAWPAPQDPAAHLYAPEDPTQAYDGASLEIRSLPSVGSAPPEQAELAME